MSFRTRTSKCFYVLSIVLGVNCVSLGRLNYFYLQKRFKLSGLKLSPL